MSRGSFTTRIWRKIMRVLIVDDDPLAQTALKSILATHSDVESFDSASDGLEALEKLEGNPCDVLLLDIHMPGLSGAELLERLKEKEYERPLPAIVFVTGHSEHAVAAFEQGAVDYVLKPFSSERMLAALARASRTTQSERAAQLAQAVAQSGRSSRPSHSRIAIKVKGRVLLIDPSEIVAVQAEGNYVMLQRATDSYVLRESISVVAEKLKLYGFIQIHRSILVNTSFVEEIKPYLTGEYGLRIKGGREYRVTRTYKKNLKSLAESWIGGISLAE